MKSTLCENDCSLQNGGNGKRFARWKAKEIIMTDLDAVRGYQA